MLGTKSKDTALSGKTEQLANETSKMKQDNVELLQANAELHDELKCLQSKKLTTFEH